VPETLDVAVDGERARGCSTGKGWTEPGRGDGMRRRDATVGRGEGPRAWTRRREMTTGRRGGA
jgi:hypothetical protein